ncbi:YlxR family protein [Mycobacterium sp.]|uniref:YlxR family protein n=1 Tax=Mycobacterium sp. TaxID=1785 RepID=UPI0026050DC6|nr:YlxR family protein [Mycobacterium sp.]
MIQREFSAPETNRAHRSTDGPVRTCVGCRRRELAAELLRVVAVSTGNGEYAVIVDDRSSLPGRGAWLHPVPQCVQQAIRRRAFTKALRITAPLDTSAVVEHLESLEVPDRPATEEAAKNMSTP